MVNLLKKLKLYHWLIICFVGAIIVGVGIGYAIDRSKNKNVEGAQTQTIAPKTESPKVEEKKEDTQPATEVQTNKTPKPTTRTNIESEATPQPTEPPPEVKTCDDTKKQAEIFFENSYYQDLVSIENQRHNNTAAMLQKTLDDCLATNPEPQIWCVQPESYLNQENNYHNSQLISLSLAHQNKLASINSTCY